MKLLTAVSIAVMALSIAFDAKAWGWIHNNEQNRRTPYIGAGNIDLYGDGRLFNMRLGSWGAEIADPYLPYLKNLSRLYGRWEDKVFRENQLRGVEAFLALDNPPPCDWMKPCESTVLLNVDYHSAMVNGELNEWWTMDTLTVTRSLVDLAAGKVHVTYTYASEQLPDSFGRLMIFY